MADDWQGAFRRGFGIVGAAEAWDLKRRIQKGAVLDMMDVLPGMKEKLAAVLMMVAGVGGMAACAYRYLERLDTSWTEWAASYAMFTAGLKAYGARLHREREAEATRAALTEAVADAAALAKP